jgi:DNA replication initiation complex subunit (GINS family)
MEEINYEILRRIQAKEKGPTLSEIPDDFYQLVSKLLNKYKTEQKFREYENVLKIIKYIHSRRQEKIVNAAINSQRGVEPPSELSPREHVLYNNIREMLKVDTEEFIRIISIDEMGEFRNKDKPTATTETKMIPAVAVTVAATVPQASSSQAQSSQAQSPSVQPLVQTSTTVLNSLIGSVTKAYKKVLIIKDVPEFMGLDGKAYGPFKSGELIELPIEEADTLINMKSAELKE